jgi:hypothetical protein
MWMQQFDFKIARPIDTQGANIWTTLHSLRPIIQNQYNYIDQ